MVRAFETILFYGSIGEIYNIGTTNEYSVTEIAQKIIKILKPSEPEAEWIVHVQDRPWNDYRYNITSTKIKDLGWQQKWSFEENLKTTILWYIQCAPNHWNEDGS